LVNGIDLVFRNSRAALAQIRSRITSTSCSDRGASICLTPCAFLHPGVQEVGL
jgi:hypothetical protein